RRYCSPLFVAAPSNNQPNTFRSHTMKRTVTSVMIALCLVLAGCTHNAAAPNTPAVPVDVRVAQYVQIVSTANANLVPVVAALKDANVITAANAQKVAQYQVMVATATKGMAGILAQTNVAWPDKALLIQNLALSLVPPAGYVW